MEINMAYILGLLIGLPILAGCALLVGVLSNSKKASPEPALTPRDLEVLQESAQEIVNSITSVAEESMRRFDDARERLEHLIARAEKAAEFLEARMGPAVITRKDSTDRSEDVVRLSDCGMDTSEIARQLNMGSGEVELLLNLRPKLGAGV
jgi:DNA-binding CsgD family transcriptional regulator